MKKRFVRILGIKGISLVCLFILGLFSFSTFASEARGREILQEVIARDNGFGDTVTDIKMTLLNAEGQESHRFLKINTLEVAGDGDKLLTFFEQPRDIKGTALLAFTHLDKDDEQWIYLPATRRVKRISSGNKSGSFMGSEFAYEDLASEEIEKYKMYTYLGEKPCGKQSCFIVERKPVDKESGYARQIVWIDKDFYRFIRIDYYDRRNALLKTRTFDDYQLYMDKYWRSSEITMKNHQSSKTTKLVVRNIQFQVGLTDRDFDIATLKRSR
ncbi:outer membrane lipoprotein-sorting protein [Xenorhabdus sp. Reich]|uniref:Outer membrane lipoprotein-sorting protein n=1 Tax=Xenorhabdus littoralis TaxID=2582835 RepID=A0ABU4SJD4_9GAMM|nr:outer membrane lipoprotein-sorting protein [Xenorhabdus sp. Reich]MDX7998705.1 outer membrane lipoprotein-sorting protein [Xenorhabdus sp. Reich]